MCVLLAVGTAAAGETVTAAEIAAAVQRLGADDFRVRRQAEVFLWRHGEQALAALTKAAASRDPEVRMRAGRVLEKVELGILPDTPPAIEKLLRRYHDGGLEEKREAAVELAKMGRRARPYLLRVLRRERNPAVVRSVVPHLPKPRALVLAWGAGQATLDEVDQVMRLQAVAGRHQRAYGAFLHLTGRAGQAVAALTAELEQRPDSNLAAVLAYLHRAAGDRQAALAVASEHDLSALHERLLLEQGAFEKLCETSRHMTRSDAWSRGCRLFYLQRAGRQADYREARRELIAFARVQPDEAWRAGEALLICGEAEAAAGLLEETGEYTQAVRTRAAQLRVGEALRLAQAAREKGRASLWLDLAEADLHARYGRRARAVELLTALWKAAREAGDNHRGPGSLQLLRAAAGYGYTDSAVGWVEQLLADTDEPAALLSQVFPAHTARWCLLALARRDDKALRQWLHRLPTAPPDDDEVDALAAAAAARIRAAPADDRPGLWTELARWCLEFDRVALAAEYNDLAGDDRLRARILLAQADAGADEGRWREAAALYARAWELQPALTHALYLQGHALTRAGEGVPGRLRMQLARVLLLDTPERARLARELAARGLVKAARRQRERFRDVGVPGAAYDQNLRRLARRYAAEGRYTDAVDALVQADASLLAPNVNYVRTSGYLHAVAWRHHYLARHRLQQGDGARALAEARRAAALNPDRVDAFIGLVRAFDAADMSAAGDALLAELTGVWERLIERWPQASAAYNNAAWLMARCRRRLDRAQAYAEKAVALAPTSAAAMDTLAEVHFQSGRREKAVAWARKAAAQAPGDAFFQKRIDEFRTAELPAGPE